MTLLLRKVPRSALNGSSLCQVVLGKSIICCRIYSFHYFQSSPSMLIFPKIYKRYTTIIPAYLSTIHSYCHENRYKIVINRLAYSGDELVTVRWRWTNASILYEVPCQKGDEGCQEHNHEEWQAGNTGCVPYMRHQDV